MYFKLYVLARIYQCITELFFFLKWLSDSEDQDEYADNSTEVTDENDAPVNAAAAATCEASGLTELSSDEAEALDYSSLAGLMAALNTHGPNDVDGDWGLSNVYDEDNDNSTSSREAEVTTNSSSGVNPKQHSSAAPSTLVM